jgi:hypothetical protein
VSEIERLRALLAEATPETEGRWKYRRCNFGRGPDPAYSYVEWGKPDAGLGTAALSVPMARYIAAMSPTTALALLDVAEAAHEAFVDWNNFDDVASEGAAMSRLRAALDRLDGAS